jgi:predicted transcriptional regulator
MLAIPDNSKLQDAMDAIIANKLRTVFIHNETEQIIGCLTEGDILRAVINGAHRNSSASVFMNTGFDFRNEELTDLNLIRWFLNTGSLVLPILGQDRRALKYQFPLESIFRLL